MSTVLFSSILHNFKPRWKFIGSFSILRIFNFDISVKSANKIGYSIYRYMSIYARNIINWSITLDEHFNERMRTVFFGKWYSSSNIMIITLIVPSVSMPVGNGAHVFQTCYFNELNEREFISNALFSRATIYVESQSKKVSSSICRYCWMGVEQKNRVLKKHRWHGHVEKISFIDLVWR